MNPEDLIPMGRDYYPPATDEETIAQLEAEILRLRTTEAAAAHALDTIRQLLGLDLVPGEHPSVTRQRIEQAILELQGRGE